MGAKLRAYREVYDYLKLFTDKLAVDFTWRVTAEKPSIQQFSTYFIVKGNVFQFIFTLTEQKTTFVSVFLEMVINKCLMSTELDLNNIVQQNFLHARDRVFKRTMPL